MSDPSRIFESRIRQADAERRAAYVLKQGGRISSVLVKRYNRKQQPYWLRSTAAVNAQGVVVEYYHYTRAGKVTGFSPSQYSENLELEADQDPCLPEAPQT